MVLTLHDSRIGVKRLLSAVRDLPESRSGGDPPISKREASVRHQQLFEQYEKALTIAIGIATPWWNGIVERTMARGGDQRAALRSAYMERPAGPASCPELVWVIRKFWLDCEAINAAVNPQDYVPPEVFLLGWLVDGQHEDMVRVVSGMPYWPIGLNELGEWV
jgi:hypothetical protein